MICVSGEMRRPGRNVCVCMCLEVRQLEGDICQWKDEVDGKGCLSSWEVATQGSLSVEV